MRKPVGLSLMYKLERTYDELAATTHPVEYYDLRVRYLALQEELFEYLKTQRVKVKSLTDMTFEDGKALLTKEEETP